MLDEFEYLSLLLLSFILPEGSPLKHLKTN